LATEAPASLFQEPLKFAGDDLGVDVSITASPCADEGDPEGDPIEAPDAVCRGGEVAGQLKDTVEVVDVERARSAVEVVNGQLAHGALEILSKRTIDVASGIVIKDVSQISDQDLGYLIIRIG